MLKVNVNVDFERNTSILVLNIIEFIELIKNKIENINFAGITIGTINIEETYKLKFSLVVDNNLIKLSDVKDFFEGHHCKIDDFTLDIETFSFHMILIYSALLLQVRMSINCDAISIDGDDDAVRAFLNG